MTLKTLESKYESWPFFLVQNQDFLSCTSGSALLSFIISRGNFTLTKWGLFIWDSLPAFMGPFVTKTGLLSWSLFFWKCRRERERDFGLLQYHRRRPATSRTIVEIVPGQARWSFGNGYTIPQGYIWFGPSRFLENPKDGSNATLYLLFQILPNDSPKVALLSSLVSLWFPRSGTPKKGNYSWSKSTIM